jgi:hypothetical protein
MTAAGAESVEFEAVGLDGKTVPRCHFFLKTLNIAILEFHYLSAAGANEMVMMALMRHIVVLGLSTEVSGLGQTRFAEEIERAVNSREPQVWIFARQLVVHLFSRDMFLLQKGIEDQFTLPRKFELMLPKMLLQDSHFFGMFRHHDRTEPPRRGIKDETEQPVKSASIRPMLISNSL